MKNLPILLSSLSFVLVAILLGMKMNEKKPKNFGLKSARDAQGKEIINSGCKIAFVDIDTLEANYDYFKLKKTEFETRQKEIDARLEKMANTLQAEYSVLQQKAEKGEMSQQEGNSAQQALLQKQQELELQRQTLGDKYMKDQEAFNKEIHDNLHKYIELYNEEKGYDYILSYSKDGSILFANQGLDVTSDIIKGMNAKK